MIRFTVIFCICQGQTNNLQSLIKPKVDKVCGCHKHWDSISNA